ncbi:MAG: UPF0175 family protein [Dehalococcoidia bacterium]
MDIGIHVRAEDRMATVTFEISDEFLCAFEQTADQFAQAMRLAAALFWYQREEMSLGRAAQAAGMSYADFMEALAAAKIETFKVDLDDLRRELARG